MINGKLESASKRLKAIAGKVLREMGTPSICHEIVHNLWKEATGKAFRRLK